MDRIISFLLAVILTLALAVPALAAEGPELPPEDAAEAAGEAAPAMTDTPRAAAAAVPTEQEAYERMIALQAVYPDGTKWDSSSYYIDRNGLAEYGCFGFAIMLQEAAFVGLTQNKVKRAPITIEDLHVGDLLSYGIGNGRGGHSVVVLEVHSDYIVLAEGNWSDSVRWGRTMTADEVRAVQYCYTYYLDDTPPAPASKNGWAYEDGLWYFYKNDIRLTGWVMDGQKRYYCDPDADGAMVRGFRDIDGETYYFSEKTDGSGGVMRTGWVWLVDTYYYFRPSGTMVRSGWVYDGGNQYYQDAAGRQVSGWQVFGDETFFLNDKRDGTFGAVVSGWREIAGQWYFFHTLHDGHFGAMQTGWFQDGKYTYYCDPATGAMAAGWQTIDGRTYYFSEKHDGSYGALVA